MDHIEKFKVVIWIIVAVAILGALFGLSQNVVSMITEWLISVGIGIILSGISGEIVETFSGNFFKKIFIIIPIGQFNFSLSLFPIITFIVKMWLFN
ncbi:MAG: hypothetical protein OIN88_08670 [Candidatus Methanoperedens sp.]|nr:hypothetical protein [Candidatus Methanoperedens sp.]MCZ7358756.1 hypothetical protein [Candidatus Methanoperedens sp.]HLB69630.1 hypothetical protein [Candidatus Methanoperedens sp.]